MRDRDLDDRKVGETWHGVAFTITQDEILAFAGQFDPRPVRLNPETAAKDRFGASPAAGAWPRG
jgi:acyl dehydratase